MAQCTQCTKQATRKGLCDACYMREYRRGNIVGATSSQTVVAQHNGTHDNIVKTQQSVNGTNGHANNMDVTLQLAQSFAQMVSSLKTEQTGISEETKLHLDMIDEEIASIHNTISAMNEKLDAIASTKPIEKVFKIGSVTSNVTGIQHEVFDDVLHFLSNGINVMLVGPAGSGKTTMAMEIAKTLNRPFYMTGAVMLKYDITGFVDATGKYLGTPFYEAFKNGGVFLWDEIDGSDPNALVAFNAALENGHALFPCGMVEKHPDFAAIAAANTYGMGGNRVYVGRNQLDAATLDRFAVIEMGYDENLENHLANCQNDVERKFVANIQYWRKRCDEIPVRHIISPRATLKGLKMLRAGMDVTKIEKALVWKGLEQAQIDKVKGQ